MASRSHFPNKHKSANIITYKYVPQHNHNRSILYCLLLLLYCLLLLPYYYNAFSGCLSYLFFHLKIALCILNNFFETGCVIIEKGVHVSETIAHRSLIYHSRLLTMNHHQQAGRISDEQVTERCRCCSFHSTGLLQVFQSTVKYEPEQMFACLYEHCCSKQKLVQEHHIRSPKPN